MSSLQLIHIRYFSFAKCLLYNISHPCPGQENKSSQCRVRNFSYRNNLFTVRIVKPSSELNTGINSLLKVALPKDVRLRQNYSCIFLKIYEDMPGLEDSGPWATWPMEREKASRHELSLSPSGAWAQWPEVLIIDPIFKSLHLLIVLCWGLRFDMRSWRRHSRSKLL